MFDVLTIECPVHSVIYHSLQNINISILTCKYFLSVTITVQIVAESKAADFSLILAWIVDSKS